jgi:hypothetical protein
MAGCGVVGNCSCLWATIIELFMGKGLEKSILMYAIELMNSVCD